MLFNHSDDTPKSSKDIWNLATIGDYREKLEVATADWPQGVEALKAAIAFAAPPDGLNDDAATPFKTSLSDAVRRALDAHAAAAQSSSDAPPVRSHTLSTFPG